MLGRLVEFDQRLVRCQELGSWALGRFAGQKRYSVFLVANLVRTF